MQKPKFADRDCIEIKNATDTGIAIYEGLVMPTASRTIVNTLGHG
jgi:hypothetical protein